MLIDDSIIRGTTSRKIVRMVRGAGAKEVHLRISCPPTISPCFYGVDTPSKRELIAANQSVEEIRRYIEADSLAYLSLDGLYKSVQAENKSGYRTACYTGNYPTQWVDVEEDPAGQRQHLDEFTGLLSQVPESGLPPHERRPVRGDTGPGTPTCLPEQSEPYLTPITIESGPIRCSTSVSLKPASFIQPVQSAPV